jgi:hypothetical protein
MEEKRNVYRGFSWGNFERYRWKTRVNRIILKCSFHSCGCR